MHGKETFILLAESGTIATVRLITIENLLQMSQY